MENEEKEIALLHAVAIDTDGGKNTLANIQLGGDRKIMKILVGLIISQLSSGKIWKMVLTAIECVNLARLVQKAQVKD